MERMLRRYGLAAWGVVGVIVLLYVYVLKPSLL
jgi:hypothetical protein